MLKAVKDYARKIPFVAGSYRRIRNAIALFRKPSSTAEIFTNIFEKNEWQGVTSVSGRGSDFEQTRKIARELPALLNDLEIATMLDVPCGDFNWMKTVDLGGIKYLGADIVRELIHHNQQYKTGNIDFICTNMIVDELPQVDLIFCRDCLVHLSFADIFRALKNICDSGSTYLLTTTFLEKPANRDIATGEWRPLNLEMKPFGFPAPARTLIEGCTEDDGLYADKALGLWRIDDLKKCLPDLSSQNTAS